MEININIAGEQLNSKLAAKELYRIADMVKGGVTDMSGFNIGYLGAFSIEVDFESNGPLPHADFWDGEHNHIHVDEEGFVVFRRGPDKEDGTEDVEQLRDQNITVAEWSKEHGGITPFTEDLDHDH